MLPCGPPWSQLLGHGFRGVIAFAYLIVPPFILPEHTTDSFEFHDKTYLMRAIPVTEYRQHMTTRCVKWDTVGLPVKSFRTLVRPFTSVLQKAVA